MPGAGDGNLLNSPADVAVDSALLVLSVCAYLPQILQLRHSRTIRGISMYYLLFNVLFSNAQLSEALLFAAYAWPTAARPVLEQISDGSLTGLSAFGGLLGHLQIFAQWACSVLVLLSTPINSQDSKPSFKNVSIISFLHAAAVLFPVIAITLPRPSAHTFERDIFIALVNMSNLAVALCFVILQVYAQILEMRAQHGRPGALSLLSLGLQVLAVAAVAVRWFIRIGRPNLAEGPLSIWSWYQRAFSAANYTMFALGCALLLACYGLRGREDGRHVASRETAPLLG